MFSLTHIAYCFLLAAAFLAPNTAVFAAEPIKDLKIGNEIVRLPIPAQFTALPKDAAFFAMREASTPPQRRLLTFMLLTEDVQKALAGNEADFEDSVTVQTSRSDEFTGRTRSAFAQDRKQLREELSARFDAAKQQRGRAEEISRAMSGAIGTSIKVGVGETELLGIFDESETSISFAFLSTVVSETSTGRIVEPTVVAQTIVLVKNRPLWILVRFAYRENRDIERAKAFSISILNKLRSIN